MSIWQILYICDIFLIFSISDLSMTPETTTDNFLEPIFPCTFPVRATDKSPGTFLSFSSQELPRPFQRKAEVYTHYFFFPGPNSLFPSMKALRIWQQKRAQVKLRSNMRCWMSLRSPPDAFLGFIQMCLAFGVLEAGFPLLLLISCTNHNTDQPS